MGDVKGLWTHVVMNPAVLPGYQPESDAGHDSNAPALHDTPGRPTHASSQDRSLRRGDAVHDGDRRPSTGRRRGQHQLRPRRDLAVRSLHHRLDPLPGAVDARSLLADAWLSALLQ